MTVRLAVIGGGVSGLTAAHAVRRGLGDEALIDVWEASERAGGLLYTRELGATALDVGAEAFIVRRPEALALIDELGLADLVVSPGPLRPAIWSGERLHPLPSPAVMGIPAGSAALGELIGRAGRDRIDAEPERGWTRRPGPATSVGELVRDRFGDAVTARSVDPMLGGVYSARADDLGLAETIPALAAALDDGAPSLTAAVTSLSAAATAAAGPVFGALRGGYRALVAALTASSGATIRTGAEAVAIGHGAGGYAVTGADGTGADYDAVIVAVPAHRAGALLADVAGGAASTLGAVRPAGSAVVACELAPGVQVPANSGILVATDSDLRIKAVTLSTQKWPHLAAGGPPVLRVSFGRLGEPVTGADTELIATAAGDLARLFAAAGLPAPEITGAVVQRWPEGLPHYAPGHLAAVRKALAELPPGLAVAGAAVNGVGVPACIGSARRAADAVTAHLSGGGTAAAR
ncbi:protoporphyrinogen oxidase [Gordonia caeni]|uniref:Coproporphyrinogen III oxidase n=1 Tax=Gordonia caeni TaxID=1007097 RepID=A0ABP7P6Q1_9ACTN